jgi:N-acetylneuraminic acid mutarotase
VAVGNKIYAIGGGNGDAGKWVEVYDTEMGGWTRKADMPTARTGLAAVALGKKIYTIGGSGTAGLTQRVDEYDIETGEWTRKADTPTARTLLAAAGADAIGGDAPGGGALATVEEYDPVSNTWTTKPNMPTARISLAAALVGRRIYAIGGYNNGYRGTVEEYFGPLFLHRKN